MKDFVLKLEGCSKEDRKKVIKLAKSVGFKWGDGDRFKSDKWDYLVIYTFSGKNLLYRMGTPTENEPIYQMPRDWNKIQEAFGVKVEPKDGEIWKIGSGEKKMIIRIEGIPVFGNENKCHSLISISDRFVINGLYGFWYDSTKEKATPEEEAEYVATEHKNGWHWDGEKMVEVPEYVDTGNWGIVKINFKTWDGVNFRTEKDYERITLGFALDNASTRDAYEAQQSKNEGDLTPIYKAFFSASLDFDGFNEAFRDMEIKALKSENKRLKQKLTKIRAECDS